MITLAFFFFVSLLYLYFVLFFDAKSTLSDAFFLVSFGFGTVLFFGASQIPRVTRQGVIIGRWSDLSKC